MPIALEEEGFIDEIAHGLVDEDFVRFYLGLLLDYHG